MTETSNYQIQIANDQLVLAIDDRLIEETVCQTLLAENVAAGDINIALVNDAAIHIVNRDFLNHDYATDVISFLYDSRKPLQTSGASDRAAGNSLDGELVISVETAVREAEQCGWSPLDELRLYVVHGLLHLCGYDDLNELELSIMRNRERAILKIWDLTPHY